MLVQQPRMGRGTPVSMRHQVGYAPNLRLPTSSSAQPLHVPAHLRAMAALKMTWANADWEHNPLGAAWKLAYHGPFSVAELTSKPLFQYYVPLIKLGGFLREQAFNLADYQDELATGKMTRGEVSRK